MAVGGDGTFIAASHHIRSVPLMGVNSAPRDSVGFYCCATRKTVGRVLDRFQRGTLPRISLQRLAIEIDGKRIQEPAINDVLYAHENLAAMARYALKIPGAREEQKSSGIWIAVPAGSGGAIGSAGGRRLALASRKFQFVVREPYHPRGRQYRLRKGVLGPEDEIEIENHVVYGVIFIDGSHISHKIRFDSRVRIRLSEYPLEVFGLRVPKRSSRRRR
jgi:NAD+ kinase